LFCFSNDLLIEFALFKMFLYGINWVFIDSLEIDVPVNYSTPVSKYNTMNSYATVEERPSVDSLLNELDNAHIYAVPNG